MRGITVPSDKIFWAAALIVDGGGISRALILTGLYAGLFSAIDLSLIPRDMPDGARPDKARQIAEFARP
jgi:hypothetical protein